MRVEKAAELTAEDARNLVVQAVSNARTYAVISDSARVDAGAGGAGDRAGPVRSRHG